jgi:DNA topoisomerase IB
VRLRRANLAKPGYRRRRHGRGVVYLDEHGRRLSDPETIDRITALVLPPAWTDVWINPDPLGHIQAVGTDAAGRRQYRYHDAWRARRDAVKFAHMLDVAVRLPRLRRACSRHLGDRGLSRTRVLAAATRLLDVGLFRAGNEEYASEDSASGEATFGLASLRRDHVAVRGEAMTFRYLAKGGVERELTVVDRRTAPVVRALLARRDDDDRLLAYWDRPAWRGVRTADVNTYLRDVSGLDMTAKDFRTWHANVALAATLAGTGPPPRSPARRRRVVAAAMRTVADMLGNTPSVARASYVDPQVLDLYARGDLSDEADALSTAPTPVNGSLAATAAERALVRLLRESDDRPRRDVAG